MTIRCISVAYQLYLICGVFFIFSIIKNFCHEKLASCEKSELVESRLKKAPKAKKALHGFLFR